MYWYTALVWHQYINVNVFKLVKFFYFILIMLFVFLISLMLVNKDYQLTFLIVSVLR